MQDAGAVHHNGFVGSGGGKGGDAVGTTAGSTLSDANGDGDHLWHQAQVSFHILLFTLRIGR